MSVKLQINMLDANNNATKTNIGYVNPEATDAKLFELAKKFCNLTNNTFVRVEKIVTTSLDGEENG